MEKKLKELFENPEFFKAFESAKSYEELSVLLMNHGVELSAEDIERSKAVFNQNGVELSEDELSSVNGGSAIAFVLCLTLWSLYCYSRSRLYRRR